MRFAQSFIIQSYRARPEAGCVDFYFAFDDQTPFVETIDFGQALPPVGTARHAGLAKALAHLSVALGISYYKAWLPSSIDVQVDLEASAVPFFRDFYIHGLGELGYRQKVDVRSRVNFHLTHPVSAEPVSVKLPRKQAILVGGGKDSLVSIEVLKRHQKPSVLLVVNPKQPMLDGIVLSGLPGLTIHRSLDPQLFELNRQGAYNGHVPITGMMSLMAVAAAFVYGFDTIVMSHERSASEGNVQDERGEYINHQYSKSLTFERALVQHLRQHITSDLHYFSLLRPLSELRIARAFAQTDVYDQAFVSCNAAYRINSPVVPTGSSRWCGHCPKCRFVFLVLATAMGKDRLLAIFDADLLDDPEQLPGYRALVGLVGHKPWECVGETLESAAALYQLSTGAVWQNSCVIRTLVPELLAHYKNTDLVAVYRDMQASSTQHHVPPAYLRLLNDYLAESE